MPGSKVLVLGGTGPAGICLLRELVYREHVTVVYARNPGKIPEDLSSNPLLEVVQGQLDQLDLLERVIGQSYVIISLLGPQLFKTPQPLIYAETYAAMFPLMRARAVSRLLALSTISVIDPREDAWSLTRFLLVLLVRLLPAAYRAVTAIAAVFAKSAHGLEWTVFRVGGLLGGCDEPSWRRDREDGPTFAGGVGKPGWRVVQKRAALARWLVDSVENGQEGWVGKMPAVSKLGGGKWKVF